MTSDSSVRDTIFSQLLNEIEDFHFNKKVVSVFDDMINRSIPGYAHLVFMIGVLSQLFIKPNGRIYDLGCSLGRVTESVVQNNLDKNLSYVCVDNSHHMMKSCQLRLKQTYPTQHFDFHEADIRDIEILDASLVIVNFTLQFIELEQRQAILQKIYDGLSTGGTLILSEKIVLAEKQQDMAITVMHNHFKRVHGYSDLEISQKRAALEKVMHPDSVEKHYQRLSAVGFNSVTKWFQSLNFVSFLATK